MSNSIKNLPTTLEFQGIQISSPVEEGHLMIPVRTICKIIDVAFQKQDSWLKAHPFYCQLYTPRVTVGADNKARMMNCLSILDIDGWLNSIGNKGRKEGSIEKQYALLAWLREEKLKFYKSIDLFMEENQYELELISKKSRLVDELIDAKSVVSEINKEIKKIDRTIDDVREKRFTGQTALPFPDNKNQEEE